MTSKSLVIVESPTKARTIDKFLGSEFTVLASNGHIRDLPGSAKEIPKSYKEKGWKSLAVKVDKDFEPLYLVSDKKKDQVKKLKAAAKEADVIYLATDEDREGESISWHLVETLKPKIPTKRLVFHEITKEAIKKALDNPREIDNNLVQAQETRRILDRLYGYELSELLWRKVKPRLSAGRVQSVATRLLVGRERERMKFRSAEYWTLNTSLKSEAPTPFEAELTHLADKKVAISKDFEPTTGKLAKPESVIALDEATANKVAADVKNGTIKVASVQSKPWSSKPAPPFVTSTLQQQANIKLRFSAKITMGLAQRLYENGFITYMRTDSTTLSEQALSAARNLIKSSYGEGYLPEKPRVYKTKVRNAQEAHEAIRPAGESFTTIENVAKKLGPSEAKLYELIWKRTVACQMKDSQGTSVTATIEAGEAKFRASGKTIQFPGFLRAYVEGTEDPEAELADKEKMLPPLKEGQQLSVENIEPVKKETSPPARYTEASLIKELEQRGIGRPSTWATVLGTVLSRDYGFKKGNSIVPTFIAFGVINVLENHFLYLCDYDFTAKMEDDLDSISRGDGDRLDYLTNFYFGDGENGLRPLLDKGVEQIDPREASLTFIGKTEDGRDINVSVGQYGAYVTDGETRASLPDMLPPDELSVEKALEIIKQKNTPPKPLGYCPETKLPVYLKVGRYGPYVQLGDMEEDKKPKMVSILSNMTVDDVDLSIALELLSLPRNLGKHPESNIEIFAHDGQYGPYVKMDEDTRSLPAEMTPLDVNLEQAVKLFSEPKKRGRRAAKAPIKDLGTHPDKKDLKILIKTGRFGPYITDGKLNASVPATMEPLEVTMDQALELLRRREEKLAEQEATAD